MRSGFDTKLFTAPLAVASWNTRALCSPTEGLRQPRRAQLNRLISNHAVFLQETHGGAASLDMLMPEIRKTCHVLESTSDSRATGGATLINKRFLKVGVDVSNLVLCKGRVICSCLSGPGGKLHLLNAHNFGIPSEAMKAILRHVRPILSEINRSPRSVSLIAGGDWNFLSPGDVPYSVTTGAPLDSHAPGSALGPWQSILTRMIDVTDNNPTHFHLQDKCVSRIDRIYIACPRWLFTSFQASAETYADPVEFNSQALSDHSPTIGFVFLPKLVPRPSPLCNPICSESLCFLLCFSIIFLTLTLMLYHRRSDTLRCAGFFG